MRQLNPAGVIGRVVAPCFAVLLLRQVFCYIKGDDEITLEKKKGREKERENTRIGCRRAIVKAKGETSEARKFFKRFNTYRLWLSLQQVISFSQTSCKLSFNSSK